MKKLFTFIFLSLFLTFFLVEIKQGYSFRVEGSEVMMVAPSQTAIQAGKYIARQGGNVVDILVTMALSLSVTTPYYASLGGGGFALVKLGQQPVEVIDFRETAPSATSENFYTERSDVSSTQGGGAVGTPGLPAGLWALHQKYGALPWEKLFDYPIHFAKNGFQVSGDWVRITRTQFQKFNNAARRRVFIVRQQQGKDTFYSYPPGENYQQPDFVEVLEQLRDKNVKGFYEGPVAADIVNTVQKAGGVLTLNDMLRYQAKVRSPITTQYQGHTLYFMPPPSSGGVVLKTAFSLLETLNVQEKTSQQSADELHLLAEILSRSFRGRILLGDSDFQPLKENFYQSLLSRSYLTQLANSIQVEQTVRLSTPQSLQKLQDTNTTHISVLDVQGNAVAMTISLNGFYGSGLATEKYGIFLNNHMDDFNTRPGQPNMFGLVQGQANNVQPSKRPLSSMSPTLVEKDGKIVISTGGAGGPRIISGVFQLLYRVLAQQHNVSRALELPRIHHQFLPHVLSVDRHLQPSTILLLQQKGHKIQRTTHIGWLAIVRLNESGYLEAAYENYTEGAAGGY